MSDTVSQRFQKLAPHMHVLGSESGAKKPALLVFHACNGIKSHLMDYAQQAVAQGYVVFVIDSFAPRKIGETEAVTTVCTGLQLSGYERSGDILAALWGVAQRDDVKADHILAAGWSHGAWALMDLMTEPLNAPQQAGLADPDGGCLQGLKGLFLVYPYVNFPARSTHKGWHFAPDVTAIVAEQDFLTPAFKAKSTFADLEKQGVKVNLISLEASHCFDEINFHYSPLMQYDGPAHAATQLALDRFLQSYL